MANVRTKAEPQTASDPAPKETREHLCSVAFCPIGLTLNTLEEARPDVIEHLLLAGREILLAAKAVIDANTERSGDGSSRLERIEIA